MFTSVSHHHTCDAIGSARALLATRLDTAATRTISRREGAWLRYLSYADGVRRREGSCRAGIGRREQVVTTVLQLRTPPRGPWTGKGQARPGQTGSQTKRNVRKLQEWLTRHYHGPLQPTRTTPLATHTATRSLPSSQTSHCVAERYDSSWTLNPP
eukprot:gene11683-34405_t